MKNRILCILFLHYHDFLHHSVKIGSDVFIYKTPHTSNPCLKIKPPLSKPHHIANLMHTINNTNNTNKLLMRKFSVWLHNCQQLYPMNKVGEDCSVLRCATVTEQAVPDVSKDLLTKLQCYILQDLSLRQHCCDLQSHTTQSTFIVLFNDIKASAVSTLKLRQCYVSKAEIVTVCFPVNNQNKRKNKFHISCIQAATIAEGAS